MNGLEQPPPAEARVASPQPPSPPPPPLPGQATTGVGSLPHTQLEMAVQAALGVDIPYLPQLPRKDPAEYMLPQALEGLPGLRYDEEGGATVGVAAWRRGAAELDARLDGALGRGAPAAAAAAVSEFEPGLATSAWPEFLWEIEARRAPWAKVQIAGPLTARWAVQLDDGRPAAAEPALEAQLERLVLARALAMVKAVRDRGVSPLLFLDEPAFYLLDRVGGAGHEVLYEEMRLLVAALRRAGARVGLHCCGNADWRPLLGLGLDVLSFDARLSLEALAACREELAAFEAAGGRLGLGIVPTNVAGDYDLPALVSRAVEALEVGLGDAACAARLLDSCLLTPACGLALRSIPDTERIFDDLRRAQDLLRA